MVEIGKEKMTRIEDVLHYIIHIDSCVFYPPQQDEKLAMDKLWDLDEKGIIQLDICEATDEEMQQAPPNVRNRLREKINSRIFALDKIGTQEEKVRLAEIRKLLFPHKETLDEGEKKDVRNLFCANKYGCCIFVTMDKKHILAKSDIINQILRMKVVTPSHCLAIVLNRIEELKTIKENVERLKRNKGAV